MFVLDVTSTTREGVEIKATNTAADYFGVEPDDVRIHVGQVFIRPFGCGAPVYQAKVTAYLA